MNLAERLKKTMNLKTRRIIGLMSGMSMDGIDLAYVEISGHFPDLEVKLLATSYRSFSREFRSHLQLGTHGNVADVSKLNVLVAQEFAQTVKEFLCAQKLTSSDVDAIGSHGHTLFHSTDEEDVREGHLVEKRASNLSKKTFSSLQVGAPSIIAELTGILTVGNFRSRDIAAGGTGAPLVSLADYILFKNPSAPVAVHNLGSISNLTVVTPQLKDLLAFDTGPANVAIDFFARKVPGNNSGIDEDGQLSQGGKVIEELLLLLLNLPYFAKSPPKAAGYKEFGVEKVLQLAAPFLSIADPKDLLRTAVEFSAVTIEQAYRKFVFPKFPDLERSVFSGGGIYNSTLMKRLRELLPGLKIEILNDKFSDAKEAISFALLANETLSGRAGSFPSTTGAKGPVILGEIGL